MASLRSPVRRTVAICCSFIPPSPQLAIEHYFAAISRDRRQLFQAWVELDATILPSPPRFPLYVASHDML